MLHIPRSFTRIPGPSYCPEYHDGYIIVSGPDTNKFVDGRKDIFKEGLDREIAAFCNDLKGKSVFRYFPDQTAGQAPNSALQTHH